MSKRYKGALLSATPPTTTGGTTGSGSASGLWTLQQEMQAKGNNAWPEAGNYVEDVFSTYLYNGTGAAGNVVSNGVDLSTKGGLVWLKQRSGTATSHTLMDTAQGTSVFLSTNNTNASSAFSVLSSFNTNGFTIGQGSVNNASGQTYASWTFRKQPKFFDVVTWTGNGTAGRTIPHNLGATPGFLIVKTTSTTGNWRCWHRAATNKYFTLNGTGAQQTDDGILFGNGSTHTAPTSTSFTVSADGEVNGSGISYVAYVFAHDAGGFGLTGSDNVISCGSFTTNGGGTATVSLGYEPQLVMIKRSDNTSDWFIFDDLRGMPVTGTANILNANLSAVESTADYIKPTSTGFTAAIGASNTWIYIAIRRGPMKVPTDGTKVFAPVVYTGNSANRSVTTGFSSDFAMVGNRGSAAAKFVAANRLTGNPFLSTSAADAESADTAVFQANPFDNQTAVNIGAGNSRTNLSGSTYVLDAFKRAPGFFDVACYTGDGLASRTIAHNLGVVPELILVKTRDGDAATGDWIVYHKDFTEESATKKYWAVLNTTAGQTTSIYGGFFSGTSNQSATAFKFTNADGFLGYYYYNFTGKKYVSYLFATCPGVSKVGSYTGNGSSQTINCGFAGGARFVMIKRTSGGGDWYVWDTARGIVAGNDPHLSLNTTAAEVSTDDSIDTDSSGFIVNQLAATNVNVDTATYIYLAIA